MEERRQATLRDSMLRIVGVLRTMVWETKIAGREFR